MYRGGISKNNFLFLRENKKCSYDSEQPDSKAVKLFLEAICRVAVLILQPLSLREPLPEPSRHWIAGKSLPGGL